MPFDTPQTESREASSFFAEACKIVAGPRPVSQDDPAWFATVPMTSPDYGKVFRSEDCQGWTTYSFDREGLRYCRGLMNGPTEGWLECQGRLFLIVSEVSR